jgi:uncharacterized protein (DUF58 family)
VRVVRMREALEYDVTREGGGYVLLTIILGIAALNTGNNLLYIVVAAMLAAMLVSGVASAAMIRPLELEVVLPQYVFALKPSIARLLLRNNRWRAPAISVRIVPPKERKAKTVWQWQKGYFGFPFKAPREKQWFSLPDLQLRPKQLPPEKPPILKDKVYYPYVPAKSVVAADVELNFPRRGIYKQNEFGIATRFPFSFLLKTRRISLERELLVYPSVEPTDEFFQVLPLIAGELEAFVRGRGNDLYRLREYLPDDPARHVDWKSSAKTGALMVREFTREDERKLRIVFDNPPARTVKDEVYERFIALCASLAWHFAEEDAQLTFAATGYNGSPELHDFLKYLALVEAMETDGEGFLDKLAPSEDYNIIVTARPRGSVPTALWTRSYFLFMEE